MESFVFIKQTENQADKNREEGIAKGSLTKNKNKPKLGYMHTNLESTSQVLTYHLEKKKKTIRKLKH